MEINTKANNSWLEYFERTKGAPPRPLLVEAVAFVNRKDEALDLGSGALNDARNLLSIGFGHVTAIDATPVPEEIVEKLPKEKFSYVISTFDSVELPPDKFDLVNAQMSLPFNPPETFDNVYRKIRDAS